MINFFRKKIIPPPPPYHRNRVVGANSPENPKFKKKSSGPEAKEAAKEISRQPASDKARWGRVEDRQGSLKEHSLKLTAKAPENFGIPLGSLEIPNLETIIFRGELLVLGSVAPSFVGIKTMQRLPA